MANHRKVACYILIVLKVFKECILLCLFILLYSFPSQHNVRNSLTFTVYNGLDGIVTCFIL
jgi:hypothetical protein